MKQFLPFILISIFLFVTMKAINHVYKEEKKITPDKVSPYSMVYPVPYKDSIILCRFDCVTSMPIRDASLYRAKPSDFKPYYFFNCKLLSNSNGLCFYPGGLTLNEESRPLYDESWKRQFVQFM